MPKVLGIEFVDIFSVPLERRLQTLSVLHYTSLLTLAPIFTFLMIALLFFTRFFWLGWAYLGWIYYDYHIFQSSSHGGRRLEFLRRGKHMEYFRDYFPISLIKTSDLDPKQNYIFGYHPHGIMGCGAFCNFGSEATGFSKTFPGIVPHLLTLKPNFMWPILRGYGLFMGLCDVSKESIQWIVSKKGPGNAAVIVIGGADEALEAHPGTYTLTLKNRKGFVKLAIRTGAHLVPVFSFGENDLFHQIGNPKGSLVRTFQDKFKKVFGFSPPLFYGRGIFNYTFGLFPYRKPISTIVGRAIPVAKILEPSQEIIDKVHQEYIRELNNLFDEHKTKYGIKEELKLNFT